MINNIVKKTRLNPSTRLDAVRVIPMGHGGPQPSAGSVDSMLAQLVQTRLHVTSTHE
jgi:hypothetical protein